MKIRERIYKIIYVVIIMASLGLAIYFCDRKAGFYIDEYYTYTISNGTQLGIAIENGQWNDTAPFYDQLVSTDGENFHFVQTYLNTASDVHPPIYYFLVHLVSSIFSGVFSKWIGLSVNIMLLIPTLIFVNKLASLLFGKNSAASLFVTAFYGLSPATMSNSAFIRMYMLLSFWTVLYAYIHVKALRDDKPTAKGFLIPVFITGFCGFLTQYFFVVTMFFITFVYAFYLLVFCKRVKDTLIYGATALMSLVSTAAVWKYSKIHIFDGYRGKGAVEQMLGIEEYAGRTTAYIGYMNDQIFGGFLPLFAVFFVIGNVAVIAKCASLKKAGQKLILQSLPLHVKAIVMLEIASILDFFVIAQISLFAPIESCRFLFQAYSLFLILIPSGLVMMLRYATGRFGATERYRTLVPVISAIFLALPVCLGYYKEQVLFLYENQNTVLNWIDGHPQAKMVLIQNDDGMYDTCISEYMKYPQIYVASVNEPDTIKDPELSKTGELLVYVSRQAQDEQACIDSVLSQNPQFSQAEPLWNSFDMFTAYYIH